jgi:hypothetical protein
MAAFFVILGLKVFLLNLSKEEREGLPFENTEKPRFNDSLLTFRRGCFCPKSELS